jgi:metal-responsive CopG/Arc/MetJ family transcriptional regulator
MKIKTSVTLSPELLEAIDRRCGRASRSEFIERAAWDLIRRAQRDERSRKDVALINQFAVELSAEAEEFMSLQGEVWEDETGEEG